jgi:hypothetical protein
LQLLMMLPFVSQMLLLSMLMAPPFCAADAELMWVEDSSRVVADATIAPPSSIACNSGGSSRMVGASQPAG